MARAHLKTLDYASALALTTRARDPSRGYVLDRSTRVCKGRGTDVEVVYHYTAIVVFHEDGTMTLDHGGWSTVTTKARMASVRGLGCGGMLQSHNGRWLWGHVPFYRGMRVDATGGILSEIPEGYTKAVEFCRHNIADAKERIAALHADPVFHAKVRLGVLHANHSRATSTLLSRPLTPRAIHELALRDRPVEDQLFATVAARVYHLIDKGEI